MASSVAHATASPAAGHQLASSLRTGSDHQDVSIHRHPFRETTGTSRRGLFYKSVSCVFAKEQRRRDGCNASRNLVFGCSSWMHVDSFSARCRLCRSSYGRKRESMSWKPEMERRRHVNRTIHVAVVDCRACINVHALGIPGHTCTSWPLQTSWGRKNKGQTRGIPQCTQMTGAEAVAENDKDLYEIMGVPRGADKVELKRAYRTLALQVHPDVSSDENAEQKFVQLSNAYEILIDDEQRAIYDEFGLEGLKKTTNKSKGAAWEAWEEFKPYQRKTRKRDARDAAAASGGEGDAEGEGNQAAEEGDTNSMDDDDGLPKVGDVVEYELSDVAKDRHDDGRTKGVGFLVSRNRDRGDKKRLTPEYLEMCEIEPLYLEPGETAWIVDPLESAAFGKLSSFRVIRSEYNRRDDSWILLDELSPGCGTPEYAEEIIV